MTNGIRGLIITMLCFALMLVVGVCLFHSIDGLSSQAETEAVERSVRSAMLTCYAVEGVYPESLDYLRQHYGLLWDEDAYIIVYDAFASNIMPDLYVLEKGRAKW